MEPNRLGPRAYRSRTRHARAPLTASVCTRISPEAPYPTTHTRGWVTTGGKGWKLSDVKLAQKWSKRWFELEPGSSMLSYHRSEAEHGGG